MLLRSYDVAFLFWRFAALYLSQQALGECISQTVPSFACDSFGKTPCSLPLWETLSLLAFWGGLHTLVCAFQATLSFGSHANSVHKNAFSRCACRFWSDNRVAVVCVFALQGYHQVYSQNVAFFLAYPVNDNLLFLSSKHVYCEIRMLPFHFVNLWNWHWEVNPAKLRPSYFATFLVEAYTCSFLQEMVHIVRHKCTPPQSFYHPARPPLRPGFYFAVYFVDKMVKCGVVASIDTSLFSTNEAIH